MPPIGVALGSVRRTDAPRREQVIAAGRAVVSVAVLAALYLNITGPERYGGPIYGLLGAYVLYASAILVAVVAERSSGDTDAAVAALDAGQLAPIDAAMAVVMAYIEPLLDLDRSLLAKVVASTFNPSRTTLMNEFAVLDQRAIDHLVEVLAAQKANGAIGTHVDPRQAATVVFSILTMATILYLTDETIAPADVGPLIREHVDLAFDHAVD